jgi:type IV fimbrial biogenesis protein FimT
MQGKNRGSARLQAAMTPDVVSLPCAPHDRPTGFCRVPCQRHASQRAQRGVTLIELMITLAVLAILAAAATPGMQALINSNRLRAAANETIATFQLARIEAVRVNRRMVACMSPDPNAAVPSCSAAGAAGWIVFQDADRNGQYGIGERLVRRATVSGNVQLLGSAALAGGVTFNADGMARDAGNNLLNAAVGVCLPTTRPQENESDISISAGSRIRVSRKNAAGKCAPPGDKP